MKLLKTFRRHRKVAFALLTLMAMISFVILPIVLDMIHGSGGSNPVVLKTTAYGPLHRSELGALIYQRQKILGLLQLIHERVARARPSPFPGQEPMTQAALVLRQIGSADEESVAHTWLLAKRAEEIGMQVSDPVISNFVGRLTEGKVSERTFRDIVRELGLTETTLFEYLRHELLAMRLEELFNISLLGMPPAQNWEYFLRMQRKAKIEAVAVPVAEFVAQTAEPTDAQVEELFQKYKHQDPNPNSPEPGFREPHRVAIEYFRADYTRFVDPTKVTEDEIKKYYDENKDFEFVDRDEKAAAKPEPKPEAKPEKPEPKAEAKPEPKAEAKPEKPEPKPEAKPEKPEPKAEPKPEAKVEKSEPSKPAEKKTSAAPTRTPFRLVSLQTKEAAAEKPASKSEAKPETKPAEAKPEPKPEAKPTEPKAEAKPETKPAEAKPEPKPEAKPESKPAEAKPAEAKAETKPAPKPVKYKPLDAVRDQIRMTLARRAAEQKAEEVLAQLEKPLREYELKWLEHAKRSNTSVPPPERPPFKDLAAKNGIASNETGLITVWELDRFDIARTRIDANRPFAEVAFGPLNLFQRMRCKDTEGNASFLFWKVEDKPERDVTLDEPGVRDRVVQAWKFREARALARAEAGRMADEARKADKPLKQVFGPRGKKIIEPEPFTWMTFGFLPPPVSQLGARLSEVAGIELAGEEFMEAVFALELGQFGVAMNYPQTVAYVIRVADYTPSRDELWDDFLKNGLEFSSLVARNEFQESQIAWLDELKAQSGFQWVEPPRRRGER